VTETEIKNIFFLSPRMQQRGITKYSLNLARELVRRGYGVSIACGHGPLADQFEEANIPMSKYNDIDRRLRSPFLARRIRAHIEEFGADVLHVQSLDMVPMGARLASPLRLPMAVTIHKLIARRRETWGLGWKAARVIAVSEAVREDLVNIGHVPKEKIEVIPNGLDLDDYALPAPTPGGVPVVGVAGPLEKVKGVGFFVEAAKLILDHVRGVQFLIAGDGAEERSLRRLARRLGISKNVIFAGDIQDYLAILKTIDILVLPSLQEGLGFTVLEAMAVGKPVVASAVGGVYSLVRDGETGFLVDKSDSKAIAGKVLQLLRDRDLAAQMGQRARAIVEKEFDIWTVADRTIEVYKLAANPAVLA